MITKVALLELIRAQHAGLQDLMAGLGDSQITEPGVVGKWSVKDIVAHLVFWEQVVADELRSVAAGRTPVAIPSKEIEPLNERNYQNNRLRSLEAIQANLQRSMREMLENVAALSEEALATNCTWTDDGMLGEHVANEMGHWQDHMAEVRAALAGIR
jgi:hypothetical protein